MFYCYKATRLSESQPGYLNQKGWDRQTIRLRRLGLVALMMLFVVGLFLSRGIDARWLIAAGLIIMGIGNYRMSQMNLSEINGTRGRVVVEDTVRRFCFQEAGSETAEIWQAGYFNDFHREFHRTFDLHLDAVLDAFKRGNPPPIHARLCRPPPTLASAPIDPI